jgi:hypothetical protein
MDNFTLITVIALIVFVAGVIAGVILYVRELNRRDPPEE